MDAQDTARPLVRLMGAGVTRDGAPLLRDIHFRLEAGGRWAVLGPNGAGKTTFLRLLRGDIPPDSRPDITDSPVRCYDLPGQDGPQASPLGLRQRLALVSGDMQDLYARHEWAISGLDAVLTGFADTALLYAEPTSAQRESARALLHGLGLEHLAQRRMSRLSSGQARALLLARALVCQPDALFLDECLEGLDAPARTLFLNALDRAAAANPALAMLFCSHRASAQGLRGELPACLGLGLVLEGGRLVFQGPLEQALALAPTRDGGMLQALGVQPDPAQAAAALQEGAATGPAPGQDFLLRVSKADVTLEGAAILHDISWTIRPGEHWAVLGANGAGKSSLLGLLAGDFWPSALDGPPGLVEYGFATPGEPLDETRRRLGRVSAALDRDYSVDLRAEEAVCSGALGSVGLYDEVSEAVRARARELMEFFGLAQLAGRRIRSLSRGQLRRVMLARAMMGAQGVGKPALLLLDEPMAGLDARARAATRELLGRVAGAGTPLVLVTHHERDLPEQINQVLVLAAGRVAWSGARSDYGRWQADRA